MLLEIVKHTHR